MIYFFITINVVIGFSPVGWRLCYSVGFNMGPAVGICDKVFLGAGHDRVRSSHINIPQYD